MIVRVGTCLSAFLLLACTVARPPVFKTDGKPASPEKILALSRNIETAEFLYQYDRAAGLGMEYMLQHYPGVQDSLALEWFCIPGDKAWRIFFGRYRKKTGRYEVFLQLQMDRDYRISESEAEFDNRELVQYAKCILHLEEAIYDWRTKADMDLFWYVRKHPKRKTFEVWLLPPFQSKKGYCYGGENMYAFDRTGDGLVDSSINIDKFRCRKSNDAGQRVVVDDSRNKYASVNAIFFALYVNSKDNVVAIRSGAGVDTVDIYLGQVKSWAMAEEP